MRKRSANALFRAVWPVLVLCALIAIVALVGSNLSVVNQRHTIELLINVILVVGLYVFAGNSGVLSFGHMSFMAVGAYVTALVSIPPIQKHALLPALPDFIGNAHLAPVPAVMIAGLAAVCLALVLVGPVSRVSGIAAALSMFAVLVVVFQVASNWEAVTRGSRTMVGVPTNTTIWSALAWAILMIVIAYVYQQSKSGLRLRATREDHFAARAAGISIPRERAIAFLLSAFVVGVGGALYAQFQGSFTPDVFYIHITFLTVAMLIVGGQKSLAGAVVGAIVLSVVSFSLNGLDTGFALGPVDIAGRTGLSDVALAIFILVVLIARRDGIMRNREFRWPPRLPRWVRRSSDTGAERAGGRPGAETDAQEAEAMDSYDGEKWNR